MMMLMLMYIIINFPKVLTMSILLQILKKWASCTVEDRLVTRIFLSDVKSRIENDRKSSSTSSCDPELIITLTEAHQRGISVYALFAVSDADFSETYMASYPKKFNEVCGTDLAYFDGVAVNNEHFSKVKGCDDEVDVAKQTIILEKLNLTVVNADPLPVHFSVSWNWDCCSCSSSSYERRNLTFDGITKGALEHMINIVDSVDVQVSYNVPSTMTTRATLPYTYWTNKVEKSDTSALYVLAYTNPNSLCQLSFSPHAKGSDTAKDTCTKGVRTEAGMYAAFDTVEEDLPGAKGGIHFMNGVYGTGITEGWPVHNVTAVNGSTIFPLLCSYCSDDPLWKMGKKDKECPWFGKKKTWKRCKKKPGALSNCPESCEVCNATGVEVCETRNLKKNACNAVECCIWENSSKTCKSNVESGENLCFPLLTKASSR